MTKCKTPKPAFTPGPYYIREGEGDQAGAWIIRSMQDDSEIATFRFPPGNKKLAAQAEANARFLATAVRMYPLLKALREICYKLPVRKRTGSYHLDVGLSTVVISNIERGDIK